MLYLVKKVLRKAVEKYKSIKSAYLSRSPREKWILIRNTAAFFLGCLGIPVSDPNFKANWYSYVSIVVAIDMTLSYCYTIWHFIGIDPVKGFLAVPLISVIIPVNHLICH